jgi:hypothetical protein
MFLARGFFMVGLQARGLSVEIGLIPVVGVKFA